MSSLQLVQTSKEGMRHRWHVARQTALLVRLCPDGSCLGVYQSPKAVADGNWSVTQGQVERSDMQHTAHPAELATRRELHEELGVSQSLADFNYLGSTLGRRSHKGELADYHVVVCIARDRKVFPNRAEVASFRWESVCGCIAALNAGSFMSPQKSAIVAGALAQLAQRPSSVGRIASILPRASWCKELIGHASGAPAYA